MSTNKKFNIVNGFGLISLIIVSAVIILIVVGGGFSFAYFSKGETILDARKGVEDRALRAKKEIEKRDQYIKTLEDSKPIKN